VIEVREATGPQAGQWQEDWRRRLEAAFGRHDVPPDWTSRQAEHKVAEYRKAARRSAPVAERVRQQRGRDQAL
jgi:hypothetical protein